MAPWISTTSIYKEKIALLQHVNHSYQTDMLKPFLQISWHFLITFFFLIWGKKSTFCDNKICHFDILNKKFYITCIKDFLLLPLQILIEIIF